MSVCPVIDRFISFVPVLIIMSIVYALYVHVTSCIATNNTCTACQVYFVARATI